MNFRIADTFTASLTRLTGDEQKASKTTAFDLQMQPAGGGMSFHKLDRAKDKNFWSVRVSSDLRLIVHKSEGSLLLCYVDHHDAAYAWAERRKLVTHPSTGAAQWVQIRETVQDVLVPVFVSAQQKENSPRAVANKLLFAGRTDEELLSFGVPQEWLEDVKQANEDTLLTLAEHLPAEAAEALLELATGGKPRAVKPAAILLSPFDHPDAQRRFRVMRNIDELQAALEYPWEKWTVFYTQNNANGWSVITTARRVFRARPVRVKPLLRCIAPPIWHARTRMRAYCCVVTRKLWRTRCARNSVACSRASRVWV